MLAALNWWGASST